MFSIIPCALMRFWCFCRRRPTARWMRRSWLRKGRPTRPGPSGGSSSTARWERWRRWRHCRRREPKIWSTLASRSLAREARPLWQKKPWSLCWVWFRSFWWLTSLINGLDVTVSKSEMLEVVMKLGIRVRLCWAQVMRVFPI